jgi:hypothetical protein
VLISMSVRQRRAMVPRAVLRAARKVSRFLDEQQVRHALAGGLAVGFHGFNRMTENVDFIIPKRARKVIEQFGPTTRVSGHLSGLSVKVDGVDMRFLFVGRPLHRGDLSCLTWHAGLPVLRLAPLVAMKVGTGLSTDTLDIVELLKLGKVSVEDASTRLSGKDLEQFQRLVAIADLEKRGEPKKARRILVAMLGKFAGSARRA